jgi:hypothetical protein
VEVVIMRVSKHAKQRWVERINPDRINPDLEQEILEAFNRAIEIYQEKDNEKIIRFLVLDQILFVHDVSEDILVTLIDIRFGFNIDIDREICKRQVQYVLLLKKNLEAVSEKIIHEKKELNYTLKVLRCEYVREFNKLRYSINYRVDAMQENFSRYANSK